MEKYRLLLILITLWGCATPAVQKPATETKASASYDSVEPNKMPGTHQPSQQREDIAGSPMGGAVQTMHKSTREMAETIKQIQQIYTGDVTLDCQGNLAEVWQKVAQFFQPKYFGYDPLRFWFSTTSGEKIGPDINDGDVQQCSYGLFTSFKRLITLQKSNEVVRTEFYVDETSGDLMVHRYHGSRFTNENYVLSGFGKK